MIGTLGLPQIAIIAVVLILLFGVGKLSGLGKDLGSSIKEFRRAMKEEDQEEGQQGEAQQQQPPVQAQVSQPPAEQAAAPPPAQPVPPPVQQAPAPPPGNGATAPGDSESAAPAEERSSRNVF